MNSVPLQTQLSSEMKAAKMEWPDGKERWDEALEALKGVWASKFNERAYISMRKVRSSHFLSALPSSSSHHPLAAVQLQYAWIDRFATLYK